MIIKNAYAKINLTLEILNNKKNGLHEIKSIMQTISLHDTLTFIERKDSKIILKCDMEELLTENNIIIKSAKWFQEYINCKKGVTIELKKRIPVSAGLGGGSSDAAATLIALNDLWKINLPIGKLVLSSIKIGSDVPFLILGGMCLVKGIGEHVTPLNYFINKKFLLIKPNINIDTAKIYREYDKIKNKKDNKKNFNKSENFINALKNEYNLNNYYYNQLEEIILNLFPEIKEFFKYIEKNKCEAFISGSGASFIVFGKQDIINNIYNVFQNKNLFSQIVYTI